MPGNVSVFEPLDKAADQIIAVSGHCSIRERQRILDALSFGVAYVGNAVSIMGDDITKAGYGPEITDQVYGAASALRSAAQSCTDALLCLNRLLNARVGDLGGRQVPHSSELNGGQ